MQHTHTEKELQTDVEKRGLDTAVPISEVMEQPLEAIKGTDFVAKANEGTHMEHGLSTWDSVKTYRKAVGWSAFISLSIVMCGYDQAIIGNFYALPAFRQRYGSIVPSDPASGFQISAAWQVGLGMGSPAGQVIGGFGIGWFLDRFGRRYTFAACLVLTSAFIFMAFFSNSLGVLTAAEMLSGVIWGAYSVIGPTYAAEVLPVNLRGYLTGYVNLCYVMGQFVAQGVTTGLDTRLDQWAYRIPFAIQWMWPVIMLSGVYWCPESPWWLVRKGRIAQAERSLHRLIIRHTDKLDISNTLAMMIKTDKYEQEVDTGSSYLDAFRGVSLRRTEICIMVYITQVFCGIQSTYFFQQLGLDTQQSFDMGVGVTGIGFVGTCLTAIPLLYIGRRPIFVYGVGIMCVFNWIIGFLDFAPAYATNSGFGWAQGVIELLITFVYQFTVGPLTFVILSEIPSTKLRSKTIAIGTCAYATFLVAQTAWTPYLINPAAANAGGKIGLLYGGLTLLVFVWCLFRLPESKGRTYEELDRMFEMRLKSKEFATYVFNEL